MLFSTISNLFTTWELPTFVLFSFLLQVALIPMGYYRKYTSNHWLRWFLWLAYLSADWVATASLGILSNYAEFSESRFVIRAVWAPFLLLHLGGPDTITAFSMQDNDLWLRHFLSFFVQVGLAFYVFFRALKPTALNFIAIPVFVCGIIKYCERTWALRSASIEHLRDRLVPIDASSIFPVPANQHRFEEVNDLHVAYGFFQKNKRVFADLVLSPRDLQETVSYFEKYDSKTAFKVVEVELGFMHDFFYTKASLIHSSYWGALFRLATLSFTLIAIAITIAAFCTTATHTYPPADVDLTLLLLLGALGLEIYSILLLIRSDWFVIWLTKIDNSLARFTFKAVCSLGWRIEKKRWSNSVPQYNLITRCIQDMNKGGWCDFLRISKITKVMDSRPLSDELKKRIFQRLKERTGWVINREWINLHPRIEQNLYNIYRMDLDDDLSILLWHIATDISYHTDSVTQLDTTLKSYMEDIKSLSEFLAYLLVSRPSLFSNGTSQMRIDNTVEDAIRFFKENSINSSADISKLDFDDYELTELSSVFDLGCWLANFLRSFDEAPRWEMIGIMWMEMLGDISNQCRMYDHIEQLGHGGDFLTHVWLLMHHIGYSKKPYNDNAEQQETKLHNYCNAIEIVSSKDY